MHSLIITLIKHSMRIVGPDRVLLTRIRLQQHVSDQRVNSYFVESADFFRIQNITLGYSLRNIKMGNYTLPGIRFSLTADRPFTTFKANSFTPELSDAEGWDTEVYPLTSTYSFGIQIDF